MRICNIGTVAIVCAAGQAFASGSFFRLNTANIVIDPGSDCVSIDAHFVWASAAASYIETCGNNCPEPSDLTVLDIHPTSIQVEASVGCPDVVEALASSFSAFTALSCSRIEWDGVGVQSGSNRCDPAIALASTGMGFFVSFTVAPGGSFQVDPLVCPEAPLSTSGRVTAAELLCLGNGQVVSASSTSINGVNSTSCPTSAITVSGGGSYDINYFSIVISDAEDDVTGDGRFNQDDVDFLGSLVGTAVALDPAYERFDFINDPNVTTDDGVDAQDVAILQCYIDAGLSSGFVGDADQDGTLDCDDIASALAQPFAGEAFPAANYKVELDADLDGDNDAADLDAVACALLQVEPSNLVFDSSLNFFDTSAFLTLYGAQDPKADMNSDGSFDFFDVSAFLTSYGMPNCLPAPSP